MDYPVNLMCLYWTTSGIFPGQAEISRFDFRERVEAVARAGFKGIGLWHTDLEHILIHRTLKEMLTILDDNGMQYLELEFLTDWFLEGARKGESDSRKKRLFEASAVLHASHVKVGDFYNTLVPMPKLVEAFASLCIEAQHYGASIGFEVMGCAILDNLPDAITLVESAGASNGGLIIDIYQVEHQGWSFNQICHIPLKYLLNVELNDGTLPSDPDDGPSDRKFCGEGQYDIQGLIRCVMGMGYTGSWAVEVMSEKLAGLPLEELSRLAFDTTMAEFKASGYKVIGNCLDQIKSD